MSENSERNTFPPNLGTDRPMVARAYGWVLGGKDNFHVDRLFTAQAVDAWPQLVDVARQNRQYLYRAVRYLAGEAGITQFVDLGSGLPTDNNVHQVAQQFAPDPRVVYIDNDPMVLTHGRALLADNPNTTVITADMTQPEQILENPEARRLIDFDAPVGVLMFSIGHCISDDADAQRAINGPMEHVAPGSYLAISHVVADTQDRADALTSTITDLGMPWHTRTPEVVDAWLDGLEPVEPGLCDIAHWRPDPTQPPLPEAPSELRDYLGAARTHTGIYEYGGLLRKR